MLNTVHETCRRTAGAVKVPANWRPPLADDQKRHQLEDPVMRKFVARASVVAFSALPAMGDSVGWTYRKDWFNRPEIKTEFKTKYKRDLAPPKTWDEFKQVAEFFQNRTIDGKKVYGAYVFTERGSEGITMGVTN